MWNLWIIILEFGWTSWHFAQSHISACTVVDLCIIRCPPAASGCRGDPLALKGSSHLEISHCLMEVSRAYDLWDVLIPKLELSYIQRYANLTTCHWLLCTALDRMHTLKELDFFFQCTCSEIKLDYFQELLFQYGFSMILAKGFKKNEALPLASPLPFAV